MIRVGQKRIMIDYHFLFEKGEIVTIVRPEYLNAHEWTNGKETCTNSNDIIEGYSRPLTKLEQALS